ncbi:MAG: IPT/TIG domain-containing protein, partial [Bradymonadaceae bacterium]
RNDLSATLQDGFAYTEDLAVYGFSPVRGSIAGNTYVEIRGRGFNGNMGVTFGSNAGKEVELLDAQTLAVRTPRHQPAAVDVKVRRGDTTATADQQYVLPREVP